MKTPEFFAGRPPSPEEGQALAKELKRLFEQLSAYHKLTAGKNEAQDVETEKLLSTMERFVALLDSGTVKPELIPEALKNLCRRAKTIPGGREPR